ncbi:MAG: hemerythrin family protein [Desulfamplus sp.]|nr:hemerythrin family protein [Desulfamplus sp.]
MNLNVDIPEIDELQRNLFGVVNELIDCREKGCCAKDSAAIVARLIDDSRYYFGKEEEFLRRCGYPESDTHSKEHRQFIKSIINIRRQVAEDKKNLSYEVINNLRDWILTHIVKYDQMYIPFVRINRYIDEYRQKR